MLAVSMNDKIEKLERRLESVDKDLHFILAELKASRKKITLEEITKHMAADRKLDADTTELIRKMRDREYDI